MNRRPSFELLPECDRYRRQHGIAEDRLQTVVGGFSPPNPHQGKRSKKSVASLVALGGFVVALMLSCARQQPAPAVAPQSECAPHGQPTAYQPYCHFAKVRTHRPECQAACAKLERWGCMHDVLGRYPFTRDCLTECEQLGLEGWGPTVLAIQRPEWIEPAMALWYDRLGVVCKGE